MHLSEYMAEHKLGDDEVALAIDSSRVSVSRYRRRLIRPSWEVVDRISQWTGGAVTALDWPAPAEAEAAE